MTTPDSWVFALGLAGTVALVVTPLAARGTTRTRRSTRLGSATGLAAGVVVCIPFLGGADAALGMGVLAALWLFAAGTLADGGILPSRLLPIALFAAAAVVTAAGLRLRVTGFQFGDVVVTVAVIYGAASAWRSAATRDGLLAGWAALIAAAAATLGGLAGQHAVAAVGAGLCGASLGFLAYWLPPTAARLRSGGAMLVGFLAVVIVLDAHPVLGTPRDAAIPTLLLALVLLDTVFVAAARLRGRRLDPRATGLVGRLRTLGLGRSGATMLLVVLQAGLAGLAVFAGRSVLAFGVAVALGAAVVGVVLVAALTARLDAPPGRWPGRLVVLGAGVVVGLIVLSAPAALGLLRAREATTRAADATRAGLAATRRGDNATASAAFTLAEADFNEARRRLSDPFAVGGLAVPVLAPNFRAARELTAIGAEVARAGRRLATTADPQRLRIRDGTVPLTELRRLQPELTAAADALAEADARLRRVDRSFLVAPVDGSIDKLAARLGTATRETRIAAEAARVLPAVLGGDVTQRYFLAVQNNAEARGTGGFIGSWGLITGVGGHLALDHFERIGTLNPQTGAETRTLGAPLDYLARYSRFEPERTWQNVNMSPDAPTVGRVIAGLLPQSGVGRVDGVVTVDPVGLAAVLRLTGPVTVFGWPAPISAENVVDVTLRQAYVVFEHDATRRNEFLGDVADAVWHSFVHGDLGNPARVLRELGRATHEKHLGVWLADSDAQRLLHDAHADAAVPRPGSDLNLVTTQNAGANKLDLYLRRKVRYVVRLAPNVGGSRVGVRAHLEVALRNVAPDAGLPKEVLGPNIFGIGPGVNRSFVTVYSPMQFRHAELDGAAIGLESQRELGYWADSTYLDVPPLSTRTVSVDFDGTLGIGADGRYTLRLVRQPLEAPDNVEAVVEVPRGWRLVDGRGLHVLNGGRQAVASVRLARDEQLMVRIEPDPRGWWERLRAGR